LTIGFFFLINQIPGPIGAPARVLLALFVLAFITNWIYARLFHLEEKENQQAAIATRRSELHWLSRPYAAMRHTVVQVLLPFEVRAAVDAILQQFIQQYRAWGMHERRDSIVGRPHWVEAIQRWTLSKKLALMVHGVAVPLAHGWQTAEQVARKPQEKLRKTEPVPISPISFEQDDVNVASDPEFGDLRTLQLEDALRAQGRLEPSI